MSHETPQPSTGQPGDRDRDDNTHDDYDPMIYDAMREAANRLKALYIGRQADARSEQERRFWLQKQIDVTVEVDEVDTRSLAAVQSTRASFVARLASEQT